MNRRGLRPVAAMIAVAALATGILTACAAEAPRTEWTPAAWSVVGQVTTDAPTAAATADTVAMRLRNDDVGIDARWAMLPGDQPINAAIEQVVRGAVATQATTTGTSYRPAVFDAGAGLGERGCATGAATAVASSVLGDRTGSVVVCEITVARGTVFGEILRTVTGAAGEVTSDTTQAFYTDLATGAVGSAADLFEGPAAVWVATVDALRRDFGSLSLADVQPPGDAQLAAFTQSLASARFAGGDVAVPVAADLHAPELDGLVRWNARGAQRPLFVTFTLDEISGALSDLGRAVAVASGPYSGPVSAGAGFERMPCDLVPCMAMTLDDGPSTLTPTFLDVLRDQHSAATFFMLGKNASRHADTVARVAAEGHEVANHTWDHPYLTDLTDAQVQAQLGDTRELLQRLSGQPVDIFRPPGGYVDDHVVELAGQPAILWSVDTRDWEGPEAAALARYAIDRPKPSTIMLMHDIQPVTESVFAQVVAGLRDRGFQLVTIDALFGGSVPSGIVRHGPLG